MSINRALSGARDTSGDPEAPAISIIIPVYNVADYLSECLDSAIGQTFSDIEVICVNDGSTDGSPTLLQQYAERDCRIVIVDKFNGGLSSARNAGLDVARGRYILFLDSDDSIDLQLCGRAFEKAEALRADVVYFNAAPFTSHGLSSHCFFRYPPVTGVFRPGATPLFLVQVSAWNRLYRHDLIRGVRFVEGIYYEDQPFGAEVNILVQRACLIDEPLYFYRIDNPASITRDFRTSMGIFASFDELKQVLHRYGVAPDLYGRLYAAYEVVNYKNRILTLPARHTRAFFDNARQRLRDVDWPLLLESCREYNKRFWPWSRSEWYIVVCLRWGGFFAYAALLVVRDWRNIKYVLFALPVVGRFVEWGFAFLSLPRYRVARMNSALRSDI